MTIKLIKSNEGITRKISDSYSVLNLLTASDSENISLAVSNAENHNGITKTSSDRVYYILEGELTVNNDLIAKKGDLVFVTAETEYNFKGSFKAILINSPAFQK